jgi:hypothetical protein
MDEFVEIREEEGLSVRAGPGSPRRGRTDPPPSPDEAEPDPEVRLIRDAQLEERGILEALSGT